MSITTTLVNPGPVGDVYGHVNVRFSVEMLNEFIALLNTNKIVNGYGNRLIFSVQEHEPGQAVLIYTVISETDPESKDA